MHKNCVSMPFLVGELCSPLQLISLSSSSWATRATQQQLEWALLHPSHVGKHVPSKESLPCPSRTTRDLLHLSGRCHPPESPSWLCGQDPLLFLFTQSFVPGELLLEAPPSPASASAVPSIALPKRPSRQGLRFPTTCKTMRLISDSVFKPGRWGFSKGFILTVSYRCTPSG